MALELKKMTMEAQVPEIHAESHFERGLCSIDRDQKRVPT